MTDAELIDIPTKVGPQSNVPDISVIVVNYNTAHLLVPMRDALSASTGGVAWHAIVVDNASRDDSVEVMRRTFPSDVLIFNEFNVGFGRANNQAVPYVRGRYALLLNTDAFVSPDTLKSTVEHMDSHPDLGILGVRLVSADGALQPSCRYFPTPLNTFVARLGLKRLFPGLRMVDDMAWDHATPRDCDWVPGCYYLIRREVLDRVGLFDPRFFMYYEEVDHCRRTKQDGWRVGYFPGTQVVHIGGESAKSDAKLTTAGRQISALQIESEHLYMRKHYGLAGVLVNTFLMAVLTTGLFVKHLVRGRPLSGLGAVFDHQRNFWRLLRATRLGASSTR